MGTSTSSAGAGAGAPFDPPWLDEAEEECEGEFEQAELEPAAASNGEGDASVDGDSAPIETTDPSASPNLEVAPQGRYSGARGQLTRFIKTGDGAAMRSAVASFVRKGLGGPAKAATRMRVAAGSAAALGGFLAAARDGATPSIAAWAASVRERGLSAQDIALEIVNQLMPFGGSVEEESNKHAMTQAIAQMYDLQPDIDILNLTDDQIASLMAYTVGHSVYNRIQLELGRAFEKLRYDARVIHERLNQVLDYVMAIVVEAMRAARSSSRAVSIRAIADATVRKALNVFGAA